MRDDIDQRVQALHDELPGQSRTRAALNSGLTDAELATDRAHRVRLDLAVSGKS